MTAASPDALVRGFSRLLTAAWHEVQAFAPPHSSYLADWLQAIDRLSGRAIDGPPWPLDELVTLDGTWYATRPPFDCVLVESGPYVFHLDDVVFSLAPI